MMSPFPLAGEADARSAVGEGTRSAPCSKGNQIERRAPTPALSRKRERGNQAGEGKQ